MIMISTIVRVEMGKLINLIKIESSQIAPSLDFSLDYRQPPTPTSVLGKSQYHPSSEDESFLSFLTAVDNLESTADFNMKWECLTQMLDSSAEYVDFYSSERCSTPLHDYSPFNFNVRI